MLNVFQFHGDEQDRKIAWFDPVSRRFRWRSGLEFQGLLNQHGGGIKEEAFRAELNKGWEPPVGFRLVGDKIWEVVHNSFNNGPDRPY